METTFDHKLPFHQVPWTAKKPEHKYFWYCRNLNGDVIMFHGESRPFRELCGHTGRWIQNTVGCDEPWDYGWKLSEKEVKENIFVQEIDYNLRFQGNPILYLDEWYFLWVPNMSKEFQAWMRKTTPNNKDL